MSPSDHNPPPLPPAGFNAGGDEPADPDGPLYQGLGEQKQLYDPSQGALAPGEEPTWKKKQQEEEARAKAALKAQQQAQEPVHFSKMTKEQKILYFITLATFYMIFYIGMVLLLVVTYPIVHTEAFIKLLNMVFPIAGGNSLLKTLLVASGFYWLTVVVTVWWKHQESPPPKSPPPGAGKPGLGKPPSPPGPSLSNLPNTPKAPPYIPPSPKSGGGPSSGPQS